MNSVLDSISSKTRVKVAAVDSLAKAELVVVFAADADGTPELIGTTLDRKTAQSAVDALASVGFSGEKDALVRLPKGTAGKTPLAVVGLGAVDDETPTTAMLRHAAGTAARSLAGVERITFDAAGSDALLGQALVEGAVLGAYTFTAHKSAPKKQALAHIEWNAPGVGKKERSAVVDRALDATAGVEMTRDLVNASPLQLYPESFADFAVKAARGTGVKVTVLDDKQLAKDGYGGLTAVGQGSSRGPRLVRLEHSPKGARQTVAFVGKGITFDTGGISLKPGAGMEQMKSDMAGAATVLGTVLSAARLGIPVRVIGYLAIAENMPSGTAGRPGDIITMYGGKTVEVLNTDAEGRLVMADALVAASEDKPDLLIDIATLTGAQLVALGKRTAGVMGDESAVSAVVDAADTADETVWPMPIPEELRATLDSTQADLKNIGQREGGMLIAAAFLREFVGEVDGARIPWAHIDIAGPSFNDGAAYGCVAKEGTGFAVRTLLAFLDELGK